MSWSSEVSDDETLEIHYNTATGETKLEDLVNEDVWLTPIDSDGTDDVAAQIVPGFSAGKWCILIGKLIEKALT